MRPRDIVVIGGSAGSIGSLKTIAGNLPSNFPGSIFVVVHVSADSPGQLAKLLSNSGPLQAANPMIRNQSGAGTFMWLALTIT